MYIKEIKKTNKKSDTVYTYYRLVHSYKVGTKIRHQNIVGLGTLEGVEKQHFNRQAFTSVERIRNPALVMRKFSRQ